MEMELRDYFAARAPVEPATWFVPVLPPEISTPPAYPADEVINGVWDCDQALSNDVRWGWEYPIHVLESLDEWLKDDLIIIDAQFPMLKPWCDQWRAYWVAVHERNFAAQKALAVQWCYAWADAMLAEREEAPLAYREGK